MLDFIPVALKNVFSRPATRNYPFVKRTPFDKQRGHISIEIDDCIFCGLCSRKCPVKAIAVNRVDRTWSIDRFKCVMCGACSEACPKKCLEIAPEYTAPANKKGKDTFVGKQAPAAPKPAAAAAKVAAATAAAKPQQAKDAPQRVSEPSHA